MTQYNIAMVFMGFVAMVGALLFIWAYVKEMDGK